MQGIISQQQQQRAAATTILGSFSKSSFGGRSTSQKKNDNTVRENHLEVFETPEIKELEDMMPDILKRVDPKQYHFLKSQMGAIDTKAFEAAGKKPSELDRGWMTQACPLGSNSGARSKKAEKLEILADH